MKKGLKEWKEKCELICCAVINGMKKHGESNVDVAIEMCPIPVSATEK